MMDDSLIESEEKYMVLGQDLESQGELQKAEAAFLKALKITEDALQESKTSPVTGKAKDLCLILADLNMQQGNMHGADVYYVKAMQYSDK